MSNPRTKPTWRWRLFRGAITLLIAFATLVAAGWWFVLPAVLHQRIDELLRVYEPNRRAFTIDSIGLRGMRITGIELGNQPWLSVGSVSMRYDLASLRAGRLLSVEMVDPVWRIERRDGRMQWGFTAPAGSGIPPSLDLPVDALEVRNGRVIFDNDGQAFGTGIAIKASRNGSGDLAGHAETGAIELSDGSMLAPIAVDFGLGGQRVSFNAAWMATSESRVTAKGDLDIAATGVSGMVQVSVPPVSLLDAKPLLSVAPQLREIEVGGRVDAEAAFTIANGVVRPDISVNAFDIRMASAVWPIAINAASTNVRFNSLSPLRTIGRQVLNIASATTGELEIRDASVEFEIASLDEIMVHEAQWSIVDGGTFRTSPFAFNPSVPVVATTIECENVDLHRWLTLITSGRADGEGRLAGRFSIAWDPRVYPRLRFLDGSLTAQVEPGWIATSDASALSHLLDEANPDFAIDARLAEVKAKIVAALGDFGYTSLRLNFVPAPMGDVILQAELKGKGRRGEKPVEFESLTINLHNFAATLQEVLELQSALEEWER